MIQPDIAKHIASKLYRVNDELDHISYPLGYANLAPQTAPDGAGLASAYGIGEHGHTRNSLQRRGGSPRAQSTAMLVRVKLARGNFNLPCARTVVRITPQVRAHSSSGKA